MKPEIKKNTILISFGITLFIILNNFNTILQFINKLANVAAPLLIGAIIAFMLAVPTNAYAKLLTKLKSNQKRLLSDKVINLLSLLLTFASIIAIIAIVMIIVIPEISNSVKTIIIEIKEQWPTWQKTLTEQGFNTESITKYFEQTNTEEQVPKIFDLISGVAGTIVGTTTSVVSVTLNILFSLISAFYFLLFRKDLERQAKKLLYAYLKKEKADKVIEIAKLTKDTYEKFLTGQCKESAILGTLMLTVLSILNLPYAALIAILTFVCAFIPYVGAFLSCGIGVFLTLLSNPEKALICLIAYLTVQFIEGQFIYPRVVGKSVGIAPIWTFMAALIGGKLFGIVGILFFIPLVAVLYVLVSKNVYKKLKAKNIKVK